MYKITQKDIYIDNKKATVYGIYYDEKYNMSDVSANKSEVKGLVEMYNKYELDSIHLYDVVTDFII